MIEYPIVGRSDAEPESSKGRLVKVPCCNANASIRYLMSPGLVRVAYVRSRPVTTSSNLQTID